MNRKRIFTMTLCVVTGLLAASAQQVTTEVGETNDNNTPLHLMKPAYRLGYGIPTAEADHGPRAAIYRRRDACRAC